MPPLLTGVLKVDKAARVPPVASAAKVVAAPPREK